MMERKGYHSKVIATGNYMALARVARTTKIGVFWRRNDTHLY